MRVLTYLSAFALAVGLSVSLPAAPAFADGIERPKVIKKQPRKPAPKRPRPPAAAPAPAPAPPPAFIPTDADDGLKLPDSFFAGGGGVGLDITGGPVYGGGFVVISGPEERFSGIGPRVPGIAQTFNPPRPAPRPPGHGVRGM